ncbi:uncharacterized protein LOC115629956 isoform X2 [Scaptodrosophila lebanonensis]|nr:uncharacterized protein LOC115629956 isoform X2 [Scaptodrosophila lebanonensis]
MLSVMFYGLPRHPTNDSMAIVAHKGGVIFALDTRNAQLEYLFDYMFCIGPKSGVGRSIAVEIRAQLLPDRRGGISNKELESRMKRALELIGARRREAVYAPIILGGICNDQVLIFSFQIDGTVISSSKYAAHGFNSDHILRAFDAAWRNAMSGGEAMKLLKDVMTANISKMPLLQKVLMMSSIARASDGFDLKLCIEDM